MIGQTVSHYRILALLAVLVAELNLGNWGQQFVGSVSRTKSLVVLPLANETQMKLAPGEQAPPANAGPVNSEAHDLYLKGRYFWNKGTKEDLAKSLEYFRQALRKDPRYAPAYAGTADYYVALLSRRGISVGQALELAKEAARKALEIDENLAEGHTSLGAIRFFYDWDWPGAEREFKRALELNPKYSTAYQWYALLLSALGRHTKAIAQIRRAEEAEPDSAAVYGNAAYVYYNAGQYEQALQHAQKELELTSNLDSAHYHLAWSYLRLGKYEQAIAELQGLRETLRKDPGPLVALAYFYAVAGNQSEASRVLSEFQRVQNRLVSPYYIAGMYLILEKKAVAFAWLETGYAEREWWMVFLHIDPMWDSLRSDPGFQDLLRRVGLPP